MLKTLDLFSGIGGFALSLEATGFFETTCFVEQEPYCQAVLRHHWPRTPILGDIKNVTRPDLPDPNPDLICGGFPCQPYSQAGLQKGKADPRHLWPEMFRLIRECRPSWVIGENVIGITKLGLDEVLNDLENEGYATRTFNIPACATGAPHLRQRLWIIAHSESESKPKGQLDLLDPTPTRHMGDTKHNGSLTSPTPGTVLRQSEEQKGKEEIGESTRASGASRNVADSSSVRLQEHGHSQTKDAVERSKNVADPKGERHGGGSSEERGVSKRKLFEEKQEGPEVGGQVKGRSKPCGNVADPKSVERKRSVTKRSGSRRSEETIRSYRSIRSEENYWSVEPNVGRLVNGLPNRVPQLRALGNSVIPQIIEEIGYAIKKAETSK
jgi:DNA (cytosine-5)-methyltransferase 1